MYKIVALLKRHPRLSFEAFIDHYETHHRIIGERVLPTRTYYARRYLTPTRLPDGAEDSSFDVVTETWFETEAACEAAFAALQEATVAAEIRADEDKLFDRSRMEFYVVREYESEPMPRG